MPDETPRPQVAFLVAALVLLVMPVLVLFGLSALGLATGFLAINRTMTGTSWWFAVALGVIWVVLVVGVVLMLATRITRRRTVS